MIFDVGEVLVQLLLKNRLMREQAEIDDFIFALERIRLWQSVYLKPKYLIGLLLCLDGTTAHSPPMYHLMNYVEEYPPDILAPTLLKATLTMMADDIDHIDQKMRFLEGIYLGFLYQPRETAILRMEYQRLSEHEKSLIQIVLQRILLNWDHDNSEEMIQAYQQVQSALQTII